MRVRAAQDPAVEHAGELDVVGVHGDTGDLGGGVHPGQRLADDPEPAHRPLLPAASWTASTILA